MARSRLHASTVAAIAIALFGVGSAHAQSTYIGPTNGNWATGTNWSANAIPSSTTDVLVVQGTTSPYQVRVQSTTSATAKSLTIGGTAGGYSQVAIRKDTQNSLTVLENITLAPGSGSAGLLLGTGAGSFVPTLTINGGTGSILDGGGSGATDISVFGDLGTLGLRNVTVDTLSINANSSGSLNIGSNQLWTVADTRIGDANANIYDILTINNTGTLNSTLVKIGGGAASGTNSATLNLNTGGVILATTISKPGAMTSVFNWNGGTIQNKSGGDLTVTGGTNGTLTISLADAATGTPTFSADSGRTITVTSTATLADKAGQNGTLTKSGSGTLKLAGANTYSGATTLSTGSLNLSHQNAIQNSTLTMNGGSVVFDSTVSGNAFTAGGLSASSSGAGYDIALQNNAGSPAAVTLTVGGNNASTTYAGVLSAAGGLTKSGSGVLTLTGANTFSGATTVSSGSLKIGSGGTTGALGSTSPITVASGATLAFNRTDAYGASLANTISGSGTVAVNSGTLTLNAPGTTGYSSSLGITVNNGATVTMGHSDTFGGTNWNATSSPTFTVNAGGTVASNNNYNTLWNLNLNGGTLLANGGANAAAQAFGLAGTVTVGGNTASLIQSGSVGNGSNAVNISGSGNSTLTFNVADVTGNANADLTVTAGLQNNRAVLSNLAKSGVGTMLLSGSNSYTGSTTVNAGQLTVNGVLGSGAVSVAAGSILAGSGTIGGAVSMNGTLSPGNSPGILTLASLVLSSSATTLMEINDLTRGSQYDGINITTSGGLTYGGLLSLSFGVVSAVPDQTTFDLFNFSGTPAGDFASVTSTGFYAGTWSQVSSGTWSLVSGAKTLTFSTATGDIIVVPEPGALAIAAAGIGLAAAWARRRRA